MIIHSSAWGKSQEYHILNLLFNVLEYSRQIKVEIEIIEFVKVNIRNERLPVVCQIHHLRSSEHGY